MYKVTQEDVARDRVDLVNQMVTAGIIDNELEKKNYQENCQTNLKIFER